MKQIDTSCLPDSAAYWWDVKSSSKRRVPKIEMIHIYEGNCSHINTITHNTQTSKYLNDITCYACVRAIKENGNVYNLIEGISPTQQSKIDKEKHRFRFGKCSCGSPMCQRTNRVTGQIFLGCTNYPTCRNTKRI